MPHFGKIKLDLSQGRQVTPDTEFGCAGSWNEIDDIPAICANLSNRRNGHVLNAIEGNA
jgi:hypothetical protein